MAGSQSANRDASIAASTSRRRQNADRYKPHPSRTGTHLQYRSNHHGGRLQAFGPLDTVMSQLCPQRSYEVQIPRPEDLVKAESVLENMSLRGRTNRHQ